MEDQVSRALWAFSGKVECVVLEIENVITTAPPLSEMSRVMAKVKGLIAEFADSALSRQMDSIAYNSYSKSDYLAAFTLIRARLSAWLVSTLKGTALALAKISTFQPDGTGTLAAHPDLAEGLALAEADLVAATSTSAKKVRELVDRLGDAETYDFRVDETLSELRMLSKLDMAYLDSLELSSIVGYSVQPKPSVKLMTHGSGGMAEFLGLNQFRYVQAQDAVTYTLANGTKGTGNNVEIVEQNAVVVAIAGVTTALATTTVWKCRHPGRFIISACPVIGSAGYTPGTNAATGPAVAATNADLVKSGLLTVTHTNAAGTAVVIGDTDSTLFDIDDGQLDRFDVYLAKDDLIRVAVTGKTETTAVSGFAVMIDPAPGSVYSRTELRVEDLMGDSTEAAQSVGCSDLIGYLSMYDDYLYNAGARSMFEVVRTNLAAQIADLPAGATFRVIRDPSWWINTTWTAAQLPFVKQIYRDEFLPALKNLLLRLRCDPGFLIKRLSSR